MEGLTKEYLNNRNLLKGLFPLVLKSYLLIENSSFNCLLVTLQTNKLENYSISPKQFYLQAKEKTILKINCFLPDFNNRVSNNEHKILFDINILNNNHVYDLNNELIESQLYQIKKTFNNNPGKHKNKSISIIKTCKFELKSVFDQNYSYSNSKETKYKESFNIKNSSSKHKPKENKSIDNKNSSFLYMQTNNGNVLSTNGNNIYSNAILNKDYTYNKEKLSKLKYECVRLENILEMNNKKSNDNFKKVTSCKNNVYLNKILIYYYVNLNNAVYLSISKKKLLDIKSDKESLYYNITKVLKYFISCFLIGLILLVK